MPTYHLGRLGRTGTVKSPDLWHARVEVIAHVNNGAQIPGFLFALADAFCPLRGREDGKFPIWEPGHSEGTFASVRGKIYHDGLY